MADTCVAAGTTYDVGEGSCCQYEACAIPCASEDWTPRYSLSGVYGVASILSIVGYCGIGFCMMYRVRGKVVNFFLCGRSLGIFVCTLALAGQSLDSNATLGNADLSYKYHFWDGAVLPIGLGLSLILNGVFIAPTINKAHCLTLPDFYGRKYGPLFEVLVSFLCCISFICLLAGNLVGIGRILQFCFGHLSATQSVFIAAAITLAYTLGGGLVSVVFADVVQSLTGIFGLSIITWYMLATSDHDYPPPSVGFPGYIYPNAEICAQYQGVPSPTDPSLCIYNEAVWGTTGVDNGAWPTGDSAIVWSEMKDYNGLPPFPNAIVYNWATIFILGFGNLSALDFQARCMAAKSPSVARWACIIAGCCTFIVGVPFSLLGGLSRYYYGPDSIYANFTPNTCSEMLDLPTCAQWEPNEFAFLQLATKQFPVFLGCWVLIGIIAASMSTSTGVLLAISTVLSHNVGQKILNYFAIAVTEARLLLIVRLTMPFVIFTAGMVASYYNKTGYLLVVAFDIVLAGTIFPLIAEIYFPNWVTPSGAIIGTVLATFARTILEYTLPKDGSLVMPFGSYGFDYGDGQPGVPGFVDSPDVWAKDTCEQQRLDDWTGVDSLISPGICMIVTLLFSYIELKTGKNALWFLPAVCLEPVPDPRKTGEDFEEPEEDIHGTNKKVTGMDSVPPVPTN